jgi:hypothetical protein
MADTGIIKGIYERGSETKVLVRKDNEVVLIQIDVWEELLNKLEEAT